MSSQFCTVQHNHTAIIIAVIELLETIQFKALTYEKIAEALNCDCHEIRYQFPSKLHLIKGLIDFFLDNHREQLAENLAPLGERDKLVEILLSFTEANIAHKTIISQLALDLIETPAQFLTAVNYLKNRLWRLLRQHGMHFDDNLRGTVKFNFLCLVIAKFFNTWIRQSPDVTEVLMIEIDNNLKVWSKYSAYLT